MVTAARRADKLPPPGALCKCGYVFPSGSDLCPVCGEKWQPKNHAFWPYHVAQKTVLRRPAEAVVLHKLAGFTNYKTGDCRPSIRTLMRLTGYTRRTVLKAIRALVDMGVLEVNDRHDESSGAQRSNRYRLLRDNPRMIQSDN